MILYDTRAYMRHYMGHFAPIDPYVVVTLLDRPAHRVPAVPRGKQFWILTGVHSVMKLCISKRSFMTLFATKRHTRCCAVYARFLYFWTLVKMGDFFSWIWAWPSGEPGIAFDRFCKDQDFAVTRVDRLTSLSKTHLLSERSGCRQAWKYCRVGRESKATPNLTHLIVLLQARPMSVELCKTIVPHLLHPDE